MRGSNYSGRHRVSDAMMESTFMLPTIRQNLELRFNYAVHFTQGMFRADNRLLAEIVRVEQGSASALFVIDSGVSDAHPGLISSIQSYCQRHDLKVAGEIVVIPGGEQ